MRLLAWLAASAAATADDLEVDAVGEVSKDQIAAELTALAEERAALGAREEASATREAALDAREAALAAREAQTKQEHKARKARAPYRPAKEQQVPEDLGVPETTPVRQGESSEATSVVSAAVEGNGRVDYNATQALRDAPAGQPAQVVSQSTVAVPPGAGLVETGNGFRVHDQAMPADAEDWAEVVPPAVKVENTPAEPAPAPRKRGARSLARPERPVDVVQVVSKPVVAPDPLPGPASAAPQRKARSLAQASFGAVDVVQAHGRAPVFEVEKADPAALPAEPAPEPRPKKGARTLARPHAGKVDVVQVHS